LRHVGRCPVGSLQGEEEVQALDFPRLEGNSAGPASAKAGVMHHGGSGFDDPRCGNTPVSVRFFRRGKNHTRRCRHGSLRSKSSWILTTERELSPTPSADRDRLKIHTLWPGRLMHGSHLLLTGERSHTLLHSIGAFLFAVGAATGWKAVPQSERALSPLTAPLPRIQHIGHTHPRSRCNEFDGRRGTRS